MNNLVSVMFKGIFSKEKYQAKPEVKETYLDDILAADQSGIDIVIKNLLETEGNRAGYKLYIISEEHESQSNQFVYHTDRIVMAKR